MEIVTLQRDPFLPTHTYGSWFFQGEKLCDTIERPWLDNQSYVSCIPAGDYPAHPYDSPSKGLVWLLENTEPRDMVEVHAANWVRQLKGCIAPGKRGILSGLPAVLKSDPTLRMLQAKLPPSFILRILNA